MKGNKGASDKELARRARQEAERQQAAIDGVIVDKLARITELVEAIRRYDFTCEAGSLAMSKEWQEIERILGLSPRQIKEP